MKIVLLAIGKTRKKYDELANTYCKRLSHYTNFEFIVIPDIKNTKKRSTAELKAAENISIRTLCKRVS